MEKIENWLDSRMTKFFGLTWENGQATVCLVIQKAYPNYLITGTNGMIDSSLLQNYFDQHQRKVGTFTPHLICGNRS